MLAESPSLTANNWPHLIKHHPSTLQITPDLETEQTHEVRRRINEVRSGSVRTIPGEQVFCEIQQSLAERRSA